MGQIAKTKYVHPEVLVDTQWVEEHLEDNNVKIVVKKTTIHKNYYDKNNFKFAFCESCYWIASILKDIFKISKSPKCGKKKIYVKRISGY